MSLAQHSREIERIQEQMRNLSKKNIPIALHYRSGHSNTTRSKSYKGNSYKLDFGALHHIIKIDPKQRIAVVEPRVTMEQLVQATLPYGLTVPVIPEFKGITVGGAIMGGSAESSSHKWGSFHDACLSYEILCGDGTLLRVSPQANPDLFYGIPCSYGSLGALVSAEIQLVPAQAFVHLRYHFFSDPLEAIDCIQKLSNTPDFIDGIVFAKDCAVVIEGTLQSKAHPHLPQFSLKPIHSKWYFQHAKTGCEEIMPLKDYLFRYDQGAFWMGAYLFRLPLLARFVGQGIFKFWKAEQETFTQAEVQKYHQIPSPNAFLRTLTRPIMTSRWLWKLLHQAEKWVQDRMIIQDFCIPEKSAAHFLKEALNDPGTFPMWLCPIKGSTHPEIFSPHLISKENTSGRFINVGIYGLPCYFAPIEQFTRKLEQKTHALGGRKVLYSRSYYTPDEFWQIYSRPAYETLRTKTRAQGVWHEITDKVLSI